MLGILLSQREVKEFEYLLKRELDEILFDLGDDRIDKSVKSAMAVRYRELFSLFKKIASPKDCLQYMITENKYIDKNMK
ncbi:hypothetical protein [Niallia sp. NCCP-28]|uniref:hypothetical protein n=1 Tax=Niallia sp. NCCP-28 TaxID=2934712 RepID=UPI002087E662|nr:hypothetical protein [Niallia sp. NCCP-28]GKU84987.1 hypothetical protein NCCP28_43830 [Niallia sp. NCCP-28]